MPEPAAALRLFVALEVPAELKARLAAVQTELRRRHPRVEARWVKPEQIHLTLRFLGNVPAAALAPLQEALGTAGQGVAPLELEAVGLGCFPDATRPRVLWAGVREATGELAALAARVTEVSAPFTREPAGPGFHPHLTLARFPRSGRVEREACEEAARRVGQGTFGGWRAGELCVFQSELDPAGSRHTVLARWPLGGLAGDCN